MPATVAVIVTWPVRFPGSNVNFAWPLLSVVAVASVIGCTVPLV
jgi:hypothetical protein